MNDTIRFYRYTSINHLRYNFVGAYLGRIWPHAGRSFRGKIDWKVHVSVQMDFRNFMNDYMVSMVSNGKCYNVMYMISAATFVRWWCCVAATQVHRTPKSAKIKRKETKN